MAKEIKIPVRTPGARQAKRALQDVAGAEKRVGDAGKTAGDKTAGGAKKAKQGVDDLGASLGVNTGAMGRWSLGGVAATAALIKGIKDALDMLQRYGEELDRQAEKAAQLTGGPGVRSLANIRGTSQAEALQSTYEQARRYDVMRATAEQASFAIESGISPEDVGGAGAIQQIEAAALQTAAISGASGATVGGLALTAREALGAAKPAQFQRFFAQALTYAKSSRVSLEELAGILNETLPLAVKAGIDPDKFMAMAASMSFRIKEPSM
ncbi:MAG TPA: hypothetical protein VMW48_08800, partial [Vicinamibacterales bacterium]|nr:hypothetical protein [Vicinamibacterales bacterium]